MTKLNRSVIGKLFETKQHGNIEIIGYKTVNVVHYVFKNTGSYGTGYWYNILKGNVRDWEQPTVYGVGIVGKENVLHCNNTHEYKLWVSMLQRCYSSKFKQARPTYEDCVASENFKYLSYFKDWYNLQIGAHKEGFDLDKDILMGEIKVYSEDVCVLVPKEINSFFVKFKGRKSKGDHPTGVLYDPNKTDRPFTAMYGGNGGDKHVSYHDNEWSAFIAYKQAKENRAKELAEKWRGQIDDRVYEKLINYKVLLTD